ncbi:MAG: flavodoxin family protein [Lachnospiraceae bacterium]|nr:flavodoxin family protein [Lachnospiraceae bacterium]
MRITRGFLEGLNENGGYDIDIVDVIKKDIKPCRGCFACWQNLDKKCVQQDDQNGILKLYEEADIIIWSFPLYCFSMPSQLKTVLDRTIPLLRMTMTVDADGRVRHVPLVDFSKKRTVVITGCGFPDWDGNFEALKLQCRNCFRNLTMVCVPETPMLNVPPAAPLADRLIAKFRDAGREFASTGALAQETIKELEIPMIPRDEYIKHANGL